MDLLVFYRNYEKLKAIRRNVNVLKDSIEIDGGNGNLTRLKCVQPEEYIHQGVLMAIVDNNELNQAPNDTDYLQMLDLINDSH